MPKEVIAITIKGVMPTANGCAVFLGNENKTFVIYVDQFVGSAIQMALSGAKKDRPLTHDLIGHILVGLGAKVEHVVINDVDDGTFFARLLVTMENELGKKIIEIDARPSDCMVLTVQQQRPLYVSRKVFDSVEDMTEVLERVMNQQQSGEEPGEDDQK